MDSDISRKCATLNLSPEQYQLLKTKADSKGLSVEGYALFKVLHEEQSSHFAPTEKLLITPAELVSYWVSVAQ